MVDIFLKIKYDITMNVCRLLGGLNSGVPKALQKLAGLSAGRQ